WKQIQENQEKESEQNKAERMAAEKAILLEKIPEWREDSERAQAEKRAVLNDLIERGFSREEVLEASDHRLFLIARDAMLYRKMKANGEVARKKLARVPKVLKPGASKPSEQQA